MMKTDETSEDALTYRMTKSMHWGSTSSLRKVQKALRIEAGLRPPKITRPYFSPTKGPRP
jgi:hypothetical protein